MTLCWPATRNTRANRPGQDGNLTVRRVGNGSQLIELAHNKIRGPGFEPINFRLDKISCDRLVDTRGKQIPTVRARVVDDRELELEERRADGDETAVVIEMLANPDASRAEIAERLNWFFASGAPAKSRVQRAQERLLRDHLLAKELGKIALTARGKEIARKAAIRTEPRTEPEL